MVTMRKDASDLLCLFCSSLLKHRLVLCEMHYLQKLQLASLLYNTQVPAGL